MLALILAFTFGLPRPDILRVPIVYAQEIDAKGRYIDALIQCESHASTTIKVLDTDGYYSYSLGQFHMKTWLDFGKNFGTTKENIYNENLQRVVIRDMLDKGLWRQWYNCSKRISASLGEYPR